MAELQADLQFLLGLALPNWSVLTPQYAGIPDEEQAALFRQALIERGVDAAALDSARAKTAEQRPVKVRLRTHATSAEQLAQRYLNSPEPAWLAPGYVPGVGLTLLAARPKRGKTLLAEYLAVQVARGGEWLGFPVVQGPAVIIQVDQGWRSTAQRLHKWGVVGLPLTVLAQRGLSLESIDALEEDLREIAPRLIVMDAAAVLLRLASEFDNQSVALELSKVSGLADRLGCAIVLIHHNRKAETAEEALVSVRGGTAWVGAADCILELYANEQQQLCLRSTPRDADPPEPVVLELDKDLLIWSRIGTAAEVKRNTEDQRYYDAIRALGEDATAGAIGQYLGMKRQSADEKLHGLLRAGLIQTRTAQPRPGGGRPGLIWVIPGDAGLAGFAGVHGEPAKPAKPSHLRPVPDASDEPGETAEEGEPW